MTNTLWRRLFQKMLSKDMYWKFISHRLHVTGVSHPHPSPSLLLSFSFRQWTVSQSDPGCPLRSYLPWQKLLGKQCTAGSQPCWHILQGLLEALLTETLFHEAARLQRIKMNNFILTLVDAALLKTIHHYSWFFSTHITQERPQASIRVLT